MSDVKVELRELRNLNRRKIENSLTKKYVELFGKLSPLEQEVMTECYINGKSYGSCGHKIAYCERQVYRIVRRSMEKLAVLENKAQELLGGANDL